jgi:hypothetical protein
MWGNQRYGCTLASGEGRSSHGETFHPLYAAVRFPLWLNALYIFIHKRCSYTFVKLLNLHIGRCKIIFFLLGLLWPERQKGAESHFKTLYLHLSASLPRCEPGAFRRQRSWSTSTHILSFEFTSKTHLTIYPHLFALGSGRFTDGSPPKFYMHLSHLPSKLKAQPTIIFHPSLLGDL